MSEATATQDAPATNGTPAKPKPPTPKERGLKMVSVPERQAEAMSRHSDTSGDKQPLVYAAACDLFLAQDTDTQLELVKNAKKQAIELARTKFENASA